MYKHMYAGTARCALNMSRQLTRDVNATENSRIMAETTDSTSCVQKLSQPKRLQAAAALAKFLRAGSLILAEVTWTGGLLFGLPAAHVT